MNNSNKLTKDELKNIVKVCLVEILEEGLLKSSNLVESKSRRKKRVNTSNLKKNKLESNSKRKSYLDKIEYNKNTSPKIKTNLSDDNLINEMLADTARSTLQEQIAADRKKNVAVAPGSDYAAKKVANSNLNDLFGNATNKWSQLAFFDKN